jgi:hypothetical protein
LEGAEGTFRRLPSGHFCEITDKTKLADTDARFRKVVQRKVLCRGRVRVTFHGDGENDDEHILEDGDAKQLHDHLKYKGMQVGVKRGAEGTEPGFITSEPTVRNISGEDTDKLLVQTPGVKKLYKRSEIIFTTDMADDTSDEPVLYPPLASASAAPGPHGDNNAHAVTSNSAAAVSPPVAGCGYGGKRNATLDRCMKKGMAPELTAGRSVRQDRHTPTIEPAALHTVDTGDAAHSSIAEPMNSQKLRQPRVTEGNPLRNFRTEIMTRGSGTSLKRTRPWNVVERDGTW